MRFPRSQTISLRESNHIPRNHHYRQPPLKPPYDPSSPLYAYPQHCENMRGPPNDGSKVKETLRTFAVDTPGMSTARMAMDLVGLLPIAQGNCKYTVLAVEYYTKWIKAKPLVT